ncbi:MAG: efflux RND transporter periplasmic adaptor subunit [Acidobacteriota bacterium]|nr:efflux RND transporter periplasmic adaptor subunit [Acidobacteriota bacterium]MDH3523063.1 efflux RND transporter periplasmic adaptor subunit [Acidobacteriota bacterium]
MTTNRRWTPTIAPLAAALALAAGCGAPEPAGPEPAAVAIEAELATVERAEAASRVELFGTVRAQRTAAVAARVMAMVTAVRVRTGEAVREGQLLLEIDPQAAQGQLSQARGALAQAQAALALAERNYERFTALAASAAASELELDMARMQYDQARGAVEQAAGAVAAASSVAADSQVVAPFAGRVARRMVDVGDLAAPGRPLVMLESVDGRRLAVEVPERVMAAAGLAVGDPVEARIDSRPDLGTIAGTVAEVTPGADPGTHSFAVEVALPAAAVAAGSSGRAWLAVDRREVVAVPRRALLRQGGLVLVVVRGGDGRAASRVVTLGDALADDRVEVLSGLAGGETVALDLAVVPPAGARLEAAPPRAEATP